MARLDLHDRGLWTNSPKDATPMGGLRRMRGVARNTPLSLRSRPGFTTYFGPPADALALARYNDRRYQVANSTLFMNGTPISLLTAAVRMRPLVAPPTAGVPDRLFWMGTTGGPNSPAQARLIRVEPDGQTVQCWGVSPPSDGFHATVQAARTKTIHSCDNIAGMSINLDPNEGDAFHLSTDNFTKQEGAASIRIGKPPSFSPHGIPKDTTAYLDIPLGTMNLAVFSDGVESPDEDWIAVGIRFDRPRRIETLQFIFTIGAASSSSTFTREVVIEDHVSRDLSVRPKGIGEVLGVRDDESVFIASASPNVQFKLAALEKLGKTKASQIEDTWITLLLPKTSFVKDGDTNNLGWSSITNLRIVTRTNQRGRASLFVDNIRLVGGVGMQGDYKYLLTFRNSVTGSRSNANATPVEALNVARARVQLTSLPVSTEPGVDRIEIWRTLGNGERFWFEADLANGITTYDSVVADYPGLHSGSGPYAQYLQPEELPTDNLLPSTSFVDAVYHAGRVFWITSESGARGRVFWSPAGRAEAVQGFVEATHDDDPMQRLILWNGRVYAFSEGHVYEIAGSGEVDAFLALEVFGVPGTLKPHAVTPCGSYGIGYIDTAGFPRLFNGAVSRLIGYEAAGNLFTEGSFVDGYSTIEPVVGAFAFDSYYLSDTHVTLVLDLRDGTWRDLGLGLTAMFAEADTGLLFAGLTGGTHDVGAVEVGARDGVLIDTGQGGQPIPYDIETPSVRIDEGKTGHAQYVFVDIDPNIQHLTVDLLINAGLTGAQVITLGEISHAGRRTETYPIAVTAGTVGVRIHGDLSQPIDLYAIELDLYQAEDAKPPSTQLQKLFESIQNSGGAS